MTGWSCRRCVPFSLNLEYITNSCFQNIKEGIEGKAVGWYSEVFKTVFPGLDRDAANYVWAKALKKSRGSGKKSKVGEKEEEDDDSGDED